MTTAGAGILNYRFNATVVIPKDFILLRNRSRSGALYKRRRSRRKNYEK